MIHCPGDLTTVRDPLWHPLLTLTRTAREALHCRARMDVGGVVRRAGVIAKPSRSLDGRYRRGFVAIV
jgi:hypothetical protein